MIVNIIWGATVAAGLISCLFIAAWAWFRFPNRTMDDVVDFLEHLDLEKAEALLDPGIEFSMRQVLNPAEFRKLQRKRIYLYIEFLHRMAKNAAVLVEFANNEAERGNEKTMHLAQTLQQEGVAVRVYSKLTLLKLHFWLLIRRDSWHVLPALSLRGARETFGIRGLESYQRMKTTTSFLFLQLHHNQVDELVDNL